jgi:hypothetical protein
MSSCQSDGTTRSAWMIDWRRPDDTNHFLIHSHWRVRSGGVVSF